MDDGIAKLLARLDDPADDVRVAAAEALGAHPPPVEAIPRLVRALGDRGSVHEDWTDWNGAIVGGAEHTVADGAARALTKLGAPAIDPLLAALAAGAVELATVRAITERMSPDQLARADAGRLTRLRVVVGPQPTLDLAIAEAGLGDDRFAVLRGRVLGDDFEARRAAIADLGRLRDDPRAVAFLIDLLTGDATIPSHWHDDVAKVLGSLAPTVDDDRLAKLVALAPRAPAEVQAVLFPLVARHHARSPAITAPLAPVLVATIVGAKKTQADLPIVAGAALARFAPLSPEVERALLDAFARGETPVRQAVIHAIPDRLVATFGPAWRATLAARRPHECAPILGWIERLGKAARPLAPDVLPLLDEVPEDRSSRRALYDDVCRACVHFPDAAAHAPALFRALAALPQRFWMLKLLESFPRDVAAPAIPMLEAIAARARAKTRPYWELDVERTVERLRQS